MSHAEFRRSDQPQRGRAAAARPGAVRRRRRASRHAACGLPAQQPRPRPHPLDRRVGGAGARGRRRRLYRGRPRRLLGAGAAAGAAAADRRTRLQPAHAGAARQRQGAPRRRAAGGRAGARAATSPRTRWPTSRSSSIRCRRSSIWKRPAPRRRRACTTTCARNVAAHVRQTPRRLRGRARQGRSRHRAPLSLRPRRVLADRDARHRRQLGRARQPAHGLGHDAGAGVPAQRARRHARPERAAGAGDRAVRRRRLRAEDHDVLSGRGGDPLGGDEAQPPGQMDRGSAGEFLRHHAGARPDPRRRDRAHARRPHPRHQGRVPARHRRLRSLRADGADQQPVHAARSLRGAELRQRLHAPSSPTSRSSRRIAAPAASTACS